MAVLVSAHQLLHYGQQDATDGVVGGQLCGRGRDEAEHQQDQPIVPRPEEIQLVSDPHGQARPLGNTDRERGGRDREEEGEERRRRGGEEGEGEREVERKGRNFY